MQWPPRSHLTCGDKRTFTHFEHMEIFRGVTSAFVGLTAPWSAKRQIREPVEDSLAKPATSTSSTSMEPPLVGRKRPFVESDYDEEYDSEEIVVASPEPRRPPFAEIKPMQAQNKRRRVLDCVLIPKPSATLPVLPSCTLSAARHLHTTPPDGEVINADPTPGGITPDVDVEYASRPKRNVKRPSYVPQGLSYMSSEDELAATGPESRRKDRVQDGPFKEKFANARSPRTRKPPARDDSPFELPDSDEEVADSVRSDSATDGVASGDASSVVSIDDISDDDKLQPKRKSTAGARPKVETSGNRRAGGKKTGSSKNMKNLLSRAGFKGLDPSLRPMSGIDDIFDDIATKALRLGFRKVLKHFQGRAIRVATMCSGTESPLLAMQLFLDALKSKSDIEISIDHVFSAEIEPFKQAYIERNFDPPRIFRDVRELTSVASDVVPMATTAYGAKACVPTDIDIVVAGTSCVDFSPLNKHQKGLSDGGESGDTWNAVLAFCKQYRPPIFLIENIKEADWDRMLQECQDAGYESAGVHVDTKDYYLPQTRERGYMICFDRSRVEEAGMRSPGDQWQSLMEKFKRRASNSVSSFLQPSDQIRTKAQASFDEVRRAVDWALCAEGHVQYRHHKRLGNARPLTHWQESGNLVVPERASPSFFYGLTERNWDLMDCAQLRKALEGYDVKFKTRIWNLTQNVYMDEDTAPFGIMPCIIPRGEYFASDAQRALTPEEVLTMQGIPLEKLSLTTETAKNLRDLAGNAMSTPVVGSGLVSALLAGYKTIKGSSNSNARREILEAVSSTAIVCGEAHTELTRVVSGNEKVNIPSLLDNVRKVMRRCYCEGNIGVAKKDIQECLDCGHTTCISCGGNPPHNYRRSQLLSQGRILPQTFEAELRSSLPLLVQFGPVKNLRSVVISKGKDSNTITAYVDLMEKTAQELFTLQHFRRTHCLTITYQSHSGRLELALDDNHAEWRLFVQPPKELACNDALRQALTQPVAKAAVLQSLFGNPWTWRVPIEKEIAGTIQSYGEYVPTWRSRMGMPDFRNHRQPEFLKVMYPGRDSALLEHPIEGTYKYLPRCGTACESLYKRIDGEDATSPLYLFLDPTRVGRPDEDTFIFATDKSSLEYDQSRQVLARLPPSWRPKDQADSNTSVSITLEGEWVALPGAGSLQPANATLQIHDYTSISPAAEVTDCRQSVEIISCSATATLESSKETRGSNIISPDDIRFFSEHMWLFEAVRRVVGSNKWHSVTIEDDLIGCHACAPHKPLLRWKLAESGSSIVPYEDSKSAATYEKCIKCRPAPVVVMLNENDNRPSRTLQLRLGLNLASLAHRARARLPNGTNEVNFEWKLITDFNQSNDYIHRPFSLRATSNIRPYSRKLGKAIELFPNQRLSLAWMRQQEAGIGQQCLIEESEEARLPQLGWTVELRAQALVHVRGGICADPPGYGKTILGLGLIESQYSDQRPSEIVEELKSRQGGSPATGLLPTPATLVIAPRAIVEQWVTEAKGKLGYKDGILAIKNTADLDRLAIENIVRAKIVVVNRAVLGAEPYFERFAAFAGIAGPATSKGRAFEQWLQFATQEVPEHLDILEQSGQSALCEHVKKKYAQKIKRDDFTASVPSRRLRGQEYIAAQVPNTKAKSVRPAPTALDTKGVGKPLLEMFYWNRIICDEFQLYDPKELTALKNLKADKRWGLSGTPAMSDFFEVANMAELLGVKLRIGSSTRRTLKQRNVTKIHNEMTDFEKFDSMREVPSESTLSRIHEIDQKFLDEFVRRNVTDFEMPFEDNIVVVNLEPGHQVVYTEISQHYNSIDMRTKKMSKSKTTDREMRLEEASGLSGSPEEALSKKAAFFRREDLEALVLSREQEVLQSKEILQLAVAEAESKELENFQSWSRARVNIDVIGDQDAFLVVRKCCNTSNDHKASKSASAKSDKSAAVKRDAGEKAESVRAFTSKVNTSVDRLLVSIRSSRFMRNVLQVQQAAKSGVDAPRCDSPTCQEKCLDDEDLAVSVSCGHVVCKVCHDDMKEKFVTQCPVHGCSAQMKEHSLLHRSKMGDFWRSDETEYGAKIEAIVRLLKDIRKKGDQAILFVQFENQLKEVDQALRESGIPASVIKASQTTAARVEDFKASDEKKTVLVLNASDETAAGLNLQNANHVIFLSPLLRDSQYSYDSTMEQAIGRVRRHGQTKPVHVYRIVALNTIDVDILEHRERRATALSELDAPEIASLHLSQMNAMKHKPEPERTQLVRGEDGRYSLQPQSWLVRCGGESDPEELAKIRQRDGDSRLETEHKVKGKSRVLGYEDYSSLIKFSRAYTEDDG